MIALPLIATSVGPSKQAKDVQTRLDSALATEAPRALDTIVNLRKDDQVSSIPWLNKKLLQFELTPYLRKVIDQANLSWSAGRLLMMSAVCFAGSVVLVDLRINSGCSRRPWASAWSAGLAPFGLVAVQTQQAVQQV